MTARTSLIAAVVIATLLQCATSISTAPTLRRWNAPGHIGFPKVLLWNATASAPRGLYLLRAAEPLQIGELVAVQPPAPLAEMLAARGSLPPGVPLLKHIAALRRDIVCRVGRIITIDGLAVAKALDRDHRHRPLPAWQGCRTLRAGDVFLLNRDAPDSFDGRYFGVLSASTITARATPFWTEAGP